MSRIMHFDRKNGLTLCGRNYFDNVATTKDKSKVTCKNCLKKLNKRKN